MKHYNSRLDADFLTEAAAEQALTRENFVKAALHNHNVWCSHRSTAVVRQIGEHFYITLFA